MIGTHRALPACTALLPLLTAGILAASIPAGAAPVSFPLEPAHSQVKLTGYGIGFLPNSGTFHDYRGTLTIDPDDIDDCKVDLTMQVRSLTMGMVTGMVLAKDFLDPDTYPTTHYEGVCRPGPDGHPILSGQLTMHGQTHPFDLRVDYANHILTSAGTLKRTEWGILGHQTMIGDATRVTMIVRLPDSIAFRNAPPTD